MKGIGGVSVPLPFPVRDDSTGLNILEAGCHSFDGDEALKYVRSRHFEYQDEAGEWHEDPSSDLGRIARQQDFLRRTLTAALKQNVLKPKIITSLYASYRDDLVIDTGMTIDKMIEFVGVVRKVTASEIRTYQIEATGKKIGGSSVLVWHKDSENMQAILNIFRGACTVGRCTRAAVRGHHHDLDPAAHDDHGEVVVRRSLGGAFRHRCDRHDCRRRTTPRCRTLRRRRSSPTQPPSAEPRLTVSVRAQSASASAARDGPATVVRRAPHSSANLMASSQSCSGAMITSSLNACGSRAARRPRPWPGNRSAGSRSCAPPCCDPAARPPHAVRPPDRSCRARAATSTSVTTSSLALSAPWLFTATTSLPNASTL